MTALKLGDTVRVVNRLDIHWEGVGRITSVCKDPEWDRPFHVSGLRLDTPLWYRADELRLVEREKS
jgi:hypothetical protein